MTNYDFYLDKLSMSKFRSKFKLSKRDFNYIQDKGLPKIKQHAYDFITKRLAPEVIANDGKQTPMHGHPVFIAQHATATCCRSCLFKWYKVPKNIALNNEQIEFVVGLIMAWIERQMKNKIVKTT